MLIDEFIKLPEERIIQYLRKDENEIEKRYSFLIKTLNTLDKNSNIDLKNIFEELGYVEFKYLPTIKEKVNNYLTKIENNHQYYCFWNIIMNLIKNYISYQNKLNSNQKRKILKKK